MLDQRQVRLRPVVRATLAVMAAIALLIACSADEPVVTTTEPTGSTTDQASSADAPGAGNESDDVSQPATDEPATDEPAEADAAASSESPAPAAATPVADPTDLRPTSIGDFASPVEIIVRPGDDRVFVVEQTGAIAAVPSATRSGATVLDISDQTRVQGERGLLGAAFHPSADLLYVHYSNLDSDSVIAEFAIDSTSGVADPDSERTVMLVEQPFNNHNGGEVAFGPDGYLYLGLGDGGSSDDPNRAALDLSTPLGKILRIDPRATSDEAFTVPSDNPFVGDANADPAIWSYGLRNPWKFSFDSATGDLWIADVGQDQWEEIDAARASDGLNAGRGVSFGWSAFEGFAPFNSDQPTDSHAEPFFAYDRSDGKCSISGGAVSRDPLVPELDGWYVYGDFCSGQIFGIDGNGNNEQEPIELAQVRELVAIAAGPDGALYAASLGGTVYRLG